MGFFYVFLFQPLIKGKYIPILWFVTCYYLEMAPKIHNNSKFSKEQKKVCKLGRRWRTICIS